MLANGLRFVLQLRLLIIVQEIQKLDESRRKSSLKMIKKCIFAGYEITCYLKRLKQNIPCSFSVVIMYTFRLQASQKWP